VVPYYGYGRTDKKDQPRVPITARLVADLLSAAGANRLLTVDLHAGQIQGFFNMPVDELTALPILTDYFGSKEVADWVVVAVDIGITKKARDVAERLGAPLAIIEKRRLGNDERTETMNVIGDVRGKVALTFDDEIDTGGTIVNSANVLKERGVKEVYCCVTHPVMSRNAPQLMAGSVFNEVVVTDTIPMPAEKRNGKITVLSVAPLLGEAIYRIHKGLSIGEMFN
jgi:ribose-phosphate pyrophosphokinase